jgi:hypothetical protein
LTPASENAFNQRAPSVGIAPEILAAVGVDQTGCDVVRGDAAAREGATEIAREVGLRTFDGSIDRQLRVWPHLLHAPDRDHAAPPAVGHQRYEAAGQLPVGPEAGVDLEIERGRIHLGEGLADLLRRIEHKDVDPTECLQRRISQLGSGP